MSDFTTVCKLEELEPGQVKRFRIAGKDIALARLAGGECHAVANHCTHLRASLSNGQLEGNDLVCPNHGARFDVTSGQVTGWVQHPAFMKVLSSIMPRFMRRNLATYEVQVNGDEVSVRV